MKFEKKIELALHRDVGFLMMFTSVKIIAGNNAYYYILQICFPTSLI